MDLAQLTSDLEALRARATSAAAAAPDTAALEAIEVEVLGKKGELTAILRGIGALPAEDRPKVGAIANEVRGAVEAAIGEARTRLGGAELTARLAAEAMDVTTPGRPIRRGSLHPIVETAREIAERLRPVRVRGLRGPGDRGRPHQLPDAEHPAGPPGARPLGHAVCRCRRAPPPNPYEPGPDPRDARASGRRSGRCCPAAASAMRRSTPATPRSSSRWKDSWSTRARPWRTSRAFSTSSPARCSARIGRRGSAPATTRSPSHP